jgi:hypothetical protein
MSPFLLKAAEPHMRSRSNIDLREKDQRPPPRQQTYRLSRWETSGKTIGYSGIVRLSSPHQDRRGFDLAIPVLWQKIRVLLPNMPFTLFRQLNVSLQIRTT